MANPYPVALSPTALPDVSTYAEVAEEYYDAVAHPTCADFRVASRLYLERLFSADKPTGTFADVGCGKSLIAELIGDWRYPECDHLVLIDRSREMISLNKVPNQISVESRVIDVERQPFGRSEFAWIFVILGDPYNTQEAWHNIAGALRIGGRCVFIVPSYVWASTFRLTQEGERTNAALFVTKAGEKLYVPSVIHDYEHQARLLSRVGLQVTKRGGLRVNEMPKLNSPKITRYLLPDDPVIDVYEAFKP